MNESTSFQSVFRSIAGQENLNFLLTNRIPRALVTRLMARFSKVRVGIVRDASIAVLKLTTQTSLDEAAKPQFESLHDCFTRELKPGARSIDPRPDVMVSPCDAIVGACGRISGTELIQIKGSRYTLLDLVDTAESVLPYRDGTYVTLRLTAGMYHRFHAAHDCTVEHVTYISGDTWNTNPVALQRVEKLFCKNERVLLHTRLNGTGHPVLLVAVASILVASVRLHFLDVLFHLKHKGPNQIECSAPLAKGQEAGWFELGSTILVIAPPGFELMPGIVCGQHVQMGQALLRVPARDGGS